MGRRRRRSPVRPRRPAPRTPARALRAGDLPLHEPAALDVLIELLPRLWKSGEGFRPLAEEAEASLEHDLPDVPDGTPREAAAEYLREFSVAPIVRSSELGQSKRHVLHRLDRLAAELGLDRERALGWTVAQTVAWSGGSDYIATHLETARWLLEAA